MHVKIYACMQPSTGTYIYINAYRQIYTKACIHYISDMYMVKYMHTNMYIHSREKGNNLKNLIINVK